MKYRTTSYVRRSRRNHYRRRHRTPVLGIILASICFMLTITCLTLMIGSALRGPNEEKNQETLLVDINFTTTQPLIMSDVHTVSGEYNVTATSAIPSTPTSTPLVLTKVETEKPVEVVEEDNIQNHIGEREFDFEGNHFSGYDMPNVYYPDIDYSFEPYMDYRKITDKTSQAYSVSHSDNAYTDEYGLRRYKINESQFNIEGRDDYIVALGTYYKPHGECGSRYLIVTTTGMFTIITGDEKADRDTDSRNMFSVHADGKCGGIVEWIVNVDTLDSTMKKAGTITAGPVKELEGTITHIYRIN